MLLNEPKYSSLYDIKIRKNKKLNSVDSIIWPWVFPCSFKQCLASNGHIIQLEAGEDLILEHPQHQLIIMIYGSLKVSSYSLKHQPYILDFYFSGDAFEYSNNRILGTKINYSAIQHCFIYALPINFSDKTNRKPNEFNQFVFNIQQKKTHQTQVHLAVLATFNAKQKVAFFLVNMFERTAIENQVCLVMRRLDISQYLSLSPETISRELNSMQRLGFISINKDGVEMHNINALRELYQ